MEIMNAWTGNSKHEKYYFTKHSHKKINLKPERKTKDLLMR